MAVLPDADEAFPPKGLPDADEAFPADIEKQRYRQQTLGTSPIQDLIFGDTSVNPIARVLDSFGQGVKQSWGASEAANLSKQAEEVLKVNKQFDSWNQGQNSLVKAANEALFRPAAVQMVKEFHDAEAVFSGVGAVIHGGQAAVSQLGEELSGGVLDRGMQRIGLGSPAQLGHDIAGAVEALPTGFHAPTGIPHAPPHPALVAANKLGAEIARARDLGVIGAGEAGYFGIQIRPIEEAQPPSGPQEVAKPAGMPVDLFIDQRAPEAKPAEAAPTPGLPAPETIAPTVRSEPSPIVEDVTQKLIAVGRPEAEARASAELIASHYQARAERFGGERGTAEQLYAAEGPDIRGEGGMAPSRSEPIKPGEPDIVAAVTPTSPTLQGGAAEPTHSLTLVDAPEGGVYEPSQIKKGEKYFKALDPDGNVTAEMLIKIDGDTARIEDIMNPNAVGQSRVGTIGNAQLRGLLNQFLDQHPEVKTITGKRVSGARAGGKYSLLGEPTEVSVPLKLRGRAAADPQTWSLYEFLAKEGGLKPTDDLKSIFGNTRGPFVPGFGPLLRKGGLTMDEALTRAKENAYIFDPNDIQHVPGAANTGELTKSVNDLQAMIAEESRGRKNYRTDHTPKEKAINPEEERTSILDDLHRQIEAAGDKVVPGLEDRTVEIVQKEGMDVHSAYERAIMEDHDRHEALLNDRRAIKETANIRGHDAPDSGATPDTVKEFIDDSGYTWASEQEASRAHVEATSRHGAHDRASGQELELFQKEQTTTPEFKKWFGDSKVVDDSGEPLQVYHGSGHPIEQFDTKRNADTTNNVTAVWGSFFTPSTGEASRYAMDFHKTGQNITPVYLSLRNPFEMTRREWDTHAGAVWRKEATQEQAIANERQFRDSLQRDGYDGIVIKGRGFNSEYVAFKPEQIKSAIGNAGKFDANSPRILNQIKRGKINLRNDAKPIITLFKDANASTFIHETGHAWLEELMKDAEHPLSPGSLRDDADTVRAWLGVHSAEDIKISHHEKFARGFERYMMEGKAPNQALANVFAHFKAWLTKIYQTVTRLKSPINDEIRGVFDRLLTLHPEDVKIEPEGPPKTFADIHEADAISASPETARPVAMTIQAERDMLANEHIPEEHDARLEGIASGTSRREARGPQPGRDGHEAGLGSAEAGNDQATGAVGAGGSSTSPEGARASVGGGKTEPPVSPQSNFTGPESALVDKAGNIRLDNLGTPEDVNKAIRDAAAESNDFIDARRGVVTDGQVLELADALGMDAGQLNTRKLGQAYNAEQIMAARKLLIQSATTVRDAMVKAAAGAETDILAYAEAKKRHNMIANQVAGITAEGGRALRAFRKIEGQDVAAQISAFVKDETGKTLFQLQQEAKLGSQLPTPAQVSKFVNDSSKPTFKDMVVEAWMSSLLSGAKTHLANIMGNTISGLWRPVETATAAAIGKARNIVTGSQDRVLFGEAAAELFGMVHGSKEGIVAAYKAFKTEEPQLTSVRQLEQGHPKALPSATVNVFGREMQIGGKQVRIPLRLLAAEDEFFKAVAFRGDINRQAYAQAAKENLPAEKFNARVAELSMTPTEEMVANAKEVADYQTFQTPLGKTGRAMQQFANSHILAKFIVPFVRTPVNLLKYAAERTPLGLFAEEVRNNLSGKNGAVARDTQIARISLGTMVGIAAFEMASQGLITGGGPKDSNKRAVMQANGWQDYSVRIGDMYYRYNRLDPFSIILGVVADAYEVHSALSSDNPEKEHIPALVFASISKNILNRASLQGASDFIQAVSDPERYGKNYIKGMVGTVVPAFLNQAAQTIDPVVRQTHTVLEGIKARIPGLSQDLLPRRDVWGEPVVREGGLGPDIASPIVESRLKNDPVNQALMAANYFPGKLDKKIRGVELTDQQYDDYSRVAGRMAKVRLNAMVNIIGNTNIPEAVRHDMIQNVIKASRDSASSLIIMQNPDIMKKAADAKLEKLRH